MVRKGVQPQFIDDIKFLEIKQKYLLKYIYMYSDWNQDLLVKSQSCLPYLPHKLLICSKKRKKKKAFLFQNVLDEVAKTIIKC